MFLKTICLMVAVSLWQTGESPVVPTDLGNREARESSRDSLAHMVLEPWTYADDFEDRDLGAWASYPLWQDIAYNENFRVNEIIPGDPNISIVQKVTPYTAVDNYAGAQKLLDMYLIPGATMRFRYYLKTHQQAEWYKVRLAAGALGKLDVTISSPQTNGWVWATVSYDDFLRENPIIAGREKVKIHALAFLAKFPEADPDMPIYLGLDDIEFNGARAAAFRFSVPDMHKLPEFKPYIPKQHYRIGANFDLKGEWPVGADKVTIEIAPYTDKDQPVYRGGLSNKNGQWALKTLRLAFPEGLYLATLKAYKDGHQRSDTEFTIHITPADMAGRHPRLLFDAAGQGEIASRFKSPRFSNIFAALSKTAANLRSKVPVESLVYDLDQFPDEDWLPTWSAFGTHIYHTGEALRQNARAYVFHGDREAGEYAKHVLLKLSEWPDWNHPWQAKRGRFSEHRFGAWAHCLAEAYDLLYDLMAENERSAIRAAIMQHVVRGTHRTYVYNDNITAATSNWLAMTVGGSLMGMAAMFDDGPETENLEPYFTGAIMKLDRFIHNVTDTKDGTWGEGFGYNAYSLRNLSYSLPSIENVFKIDLSEPLATTYNEYIWAGWIKDKRGFEYGDSKSELASANSWAYLLSKYKTPRLSWFYRFLKDKETYDDVLFDTDNIPEENPFGENPVKLFRKIGTTVFKSGWETDDFVFVMRTGPFYNHQHLDQGSFWLADRGKIFVEDRPLSSSNYYDDPIYESRFTQPIGHSTILVDGNHQSQRVGDPLNFAPGFDDHAYVSHFLDGRDVSFVTGDIGNLYWGKVKGLSRNVLYLKPRTVLMLDVATPAQERDAAINLLYQTARFDDIDVGQERSSITKDGTSMHVLHLAPQTVEVQAVKTPHYLNTLRNVKPLEWGGMLTVGSKTEGKPLVMANLLTTTAAGGTPDVTTVVGVGFVSGMASGQPFAFSTDLGRSYAVERFVTDALALSWGKGRVFVAQAKAYQDEDIVLKSDTPITFELSEDDGTISYYLEQPGQLVVNLTTEPSAVIVNSKRLAPSAYSGKGKVLEFRVPPGEGTIVINW